MFLAVLASRREPAPAPFGAAPEAFSAERARVILGRLAGDGSPHPIGTDANEGVRDRLLDELRAVGLKPSVELGFVCSPYASCASVQNIVAKVAGASSGPAVVLNAHYDSVAAGPGAGDDLSAVAALVEVARALRAGRIPARDIVLLFDDGEEAGLLGAEAWVRRHDPKSVHAMVVLESRGSSGRALMFETSAGNARLVDEYARASESPATSSLSFAIYQLLPNDTNFTVFKREGIRGMAIAAIEDPAQYHTPANKVENIDVGTIQHFGDSALSLARSLDEAKLDAPSGNASYFDVLGAFVVRWPESWNPALAIIAALLVFWGLGAGIRRGEASMRGSAIAFALALAVIAVAALLARALLLVADVRMLGTDWPASSGWLEGTGWAIAFASVAYGVHLARRRVTPADGWNAFGLVWSIAAVALAFLLPGGAYCLFVPLLGAQVVSLFGRAGRGAAPLVALGLGALILFGVALDLPIAMGIGMLPAAIALIAMVVLAAVPMVLAGEVASQTGALALVLAAASFVGFLASPVWTPSSPRKLSLVQIDPAGESSARLVAPDVGSEKTAPPVEGAAAWRREPIPEMSVGLRGAPRPYWWSPIAPSGEPAPEASLESWEPKADGRTHATIRVRSTRGARVMRFRLDPALEPRILRVADFTFETPSESAIVTVHTLGPDGVDIEFEFTATKGATLTLQDETAGLPAPARAVADARSGAMVPIHRGDRLVVSRTVGLTPALR